MSPPFDELRRSTAVRRCAPAEVRRWASAVVGQYAPVVGRLCVAVALGAALVACGSRDSRPPEQASVDSAVDVAAGDRAFPEDIEVPDAVMGAYLEALDAMAAGAWAEAQSRLEPLVADYPMLTGPLVNLAIAYRQSGRDVDAEALLERALALDPEHPAANNELGILQRERGGFAAAEAAYRRAIAGDPEYALAHYNLGVLLDIYLQRREEALEHYERYQALAQVPDASVAAWAADLRRRLGLPTEDVRLAQEDRE